MANRFVHFATLDGYKNYIANNTIENSQIVFIKDVGLIYTHGQYYKCYQSNDIDSLVEIPTFTKELLSKLEGIASGAEVNQNAFSKVNINNASGTSLGVLTADSKEDTVTFQAGDYIQFTLDSTGDKITVKAVIPDVTTSAHGLMTAADKIKLNGIAENANNYSHPGGGGANKSQGLYKFSTDATSHVTNVVSVALKDLTDLGVAPKDNPEFTGTPTAPTAGTTTNNTQVATTAFVHALVNQLNASVTSVLVFKGTLGTGGSVTALPDSHSLGWTYVVATAGTYAGKVCEVGDMVICIVTGSTANNSDWTVVQTNINGAVTGPDSSVSGNVPVFNGTTGKVIKDSGFTIAKSVPADAKFTDTVYLLPQATKDILGGVKVGNNLSVDSGVLSLTKDNVTAALGYTPPTKDTKLNVCYVNIGQEEWFNMINGITNGYAYGSFEGDWTDINNINILFINGIQLEYMSVNGNTIRGEITYVSSDSESSSISIGWAKLAVDYTMRTITVIDASPVIVNEVPNRLANSLKVSLNNGVTEGTDLFTFSGSANKTVNITPASIKAVPRSEWDWYEGN